jgi:cob(I)alamin adenosyltransferase
MLTLYDHIQELRAELRSGHLTRRERAEAEAELARATVRQAERDRALDAAFELEIRSAKAPE